MPTTTVGGPAYRTGRKCPACAIRITPRFQATVGEFAEDGVRSVRVVST